MRRWIIVAAVVTAGTVATWVLNVSRPGTVVTGCLRGCSAAPARRPGPLRVFSLNVLHGYPGFEGLRRRLDMIADEIRARDADIVC
ncbi:MAG: endonuclease/exonuclease/phosphatase family protein, partial [Myxococcota bacterium]